VGREEKKNHPAKKEGREKMGSREGKKKLFEVKKFFGRGCRNEDQTERRVIVTFLEKGGGGVTARSRF